MTYRLPLRACGPLLALALVPSLATGQSPEPTSGNPADELVKAARGHEKAHRWDEAVQTWLQVLVVDRGNTEAREAIPRDVRLARQAQRYRDTSFLERVLTLSSADVLALYREVLVKVQAHYLEPEKASVQRLFRQGLDELVAALADPNFLRRYVAADEARVAKFRADIHSAWAGRDVLSVKEAAEVVSAIGAAAKKLLGMRSLNPVVCEFICGACNSLDEYSAYLSASQYLTETYGSPQLSVHTKVDPAGNVAYMRISHFQPSTPQEVEGELKKLLMSGAVRALVLDLRGNAGGLFTAAVKTAEQFLPGGIIVTAQGPSDEANKVYSSAAGNAATDLPMIVLVDSETASAAEVLAVALRDNRRAKLIGTATFGKGTVQKVISFTTAEEFDPESGKTRPRAAVRVTLARLIAPNGTPITGVGVTPDQLEPIRERQYEAAMHQARDLARHYMGMSMMMPMMRE